MSAVSPSIAGFINGEFPASLTFRVPRNDKEARLSVSGMGRYIIS
jgi:hypothetical protein